MKHVISIFLAMIAIPFLCPFSALSADDRDARKIMELVDNQDDGDNMVSEMEMTLIDKNGNERIRNMKSFSKDQGADTLRIMFFLYPADIKGTGFLTHEYDAPGKDDDQWLYLPALKNTKRIASTDKSEKFMGSDFTYSDMGSIELEDYDFSFFEDQKEIDIEGNKCWIIWAIPKTKDVIKKTGYEKSLLFIRQDNYYLIRGKFWLEKGGYIKFLEVTELKKIDGIWTATELYMKKTRNNVQEHKTILKFINVKYNQDLDYGMFTERQLEKGI
ncbi:MAG: outer membrane lipoprotein-sorting protein [Proteobacteria bacterium]|nr:outer membrane lipoprotein-sorting protein [Pseudomonadota bacterium]